MADQQSASSVVKLPPWTSPVKTPPTWAAPRASPPPAWQSAPPGPPVYRKDLRPPPLPQPCTTLALPAHPVTTHNTSQDWLPLLQLPFRQIVVLRFPQAVPRFPLSLGRAVSCTICQTPTGSSWRTSAIHPLTCQHQLLQISKQLNSFRTQDFHRQEFLNS